MCISVYKHAKQIDHFAANAKGCHLCHPRRCRCYACYSVAEIAISVLCLNIAMSARWQPRLPERDRLFHRNITLPETPIIMAENDVHSPSGFNKVTLVFRKCLRQIQVHVVSIT